MKSIILTITFCMLGSIMTGSYAGAQIKMNMSASIDKKTAQLMDDLMNRRVSISPASTTISNNSKSVLLEFHNPTDDTLEMEIKVSNKVPNITKRIDLEDSKKSKPLLSDKESEVTSIYKPLGEWIKNYPQKMTLAPGEKKSVNIDIAVPESLNDGEYAAWIVAEVAPRKSLLMESKEKEEDSKLAGKMEGISITVSSGKIVYVAGNNKSELQDKKE